VLPLAVAIFIVLAGRSVLAPRRELLSVAIPPAQLAYRVIAGSVAIHLYPAENSQVTGTVAKGELLVAIGSTRDERWRHVGGAGWDGWVLSSQLTSGAFRLALQGREAVLLPRGL